MAIARLAVGLVVVMVADQMAAPTTAAEGACGRVARETITLPSYAPGRLPVTIQFKGVEFVIALDDCLQILRPIHSEVPTEFDAALDYYSVTREVLPQTRRIDLGERAGEEVEMFLYRAIQRGVAFCWDPKISQPVREIRICPAGGNFFPCRQESKAMCGCAFDDYCLPDGVRLFSRQSICS